MLYPRLSLHNVRREETHLVPDSAMGSTGGLTLGTNTHDRETVAARSTKQRLNHCKREEDGVCCQKGGAGTASSLISLNPTSLHSGNFEMHNAESPF